jgi:hypothetical protein
MYKEVNLVGFFFYPFLRKNWIGRGVTESHSGECKETARWGGWVNYRVVPGSNWSGRKVSETWKIGRRNQTRERSDYLQIPLFINWLMKKIVEIPACFNYYPFISSIIPFIALLIEFFLSLIIVMKLQWVCRFKRELNQCDYCKKFGSIHDVWFF